MNLSDLTMLKDHIQVIAAIIGGSLLLFKRVRIIIIRLFHILSGYKFKREVMNRLADIYEKIEAIQHETTYNSGSSMKDGIARLEARIQNNFYESNRLIIELEKEEGAVIDMTRIMCDLFSCGEKDILGHNWQQFIKWEDLSKATTAISKAMEKNCPTSFSAEFVNIDRCSIGKWFVKIQPIGNKAGKPVLFLAKFYANSDEAIERCRSEGWKCLFNS